MNQQPIDSNIHDTDSNDTTEDENTECTSKYRNKFDLKTESTANDAILSKFSAISLKYYDDKFLRLLFKSQSQYLAASNKRKPPIINRGYYARVKVVEHFVKKFLLTTQQDYSTRQIISLGSGLDTLGYRLLTSETFNKGLKYIEVDFPNVIQKKLMFTMKKDVLPDLMKHESNNNNNDSGINNKTSNSDITSDGLLNSRSFEITHGYEIGSLKLLQADLRNSAQLKDILINSGVQFDVPSFILTECVLVYIDKNSANDLITMMSSLFCNAIAPCVWLSYDMIQPNDLFGKTMLSNLTAAGHQIPGFTDFPSLEAQQERFQQSATIIDRKWDNIKSCTMLQAYEDFILLEEKERIKKLEIFDEIEEWELIMNHYSLTLAMKGLDLLNTT